MGKEDKEKKRDAQNDSENVFQRIVQACDIDSSLEGGGDGMPNPDLKNLSLQQTYMV